MRAPNLLALFSLLLVAEPTEAAPAPPATDAPPLSIDRSSLPRTTLRIVPVAVTHGRERVVVQGGGGTLLDLPVFAYLIEHPTEGLIVIDPGFPRRTGIDASSYPGRRMAKLLALEMTPGAALVERLPEAGFAPGDVRHVFVTHLHADHVGGLEDFPQARFWVQPTAWAERGQGGLLGKPDLSVFAGHQEPTMLSLSGGGVGPFARSLDLFGDGSVIALDTPGHTAGHTSFLIHLPTASVLITGDAAWMDPHWREPALKGGLVRTLLEHDWKANWDSQWRIHAIAEQNPDLVVLSGHDGANLGRLPAWPAPLQ